MKLELTGNAATVVLEQWIQPSYSTGTGYFGDGMKGAGFLSEDHAEIRLMLVENKSASFITWRRKPRELAASEPKQLTVGDQA
jgi:hypothetical protein